MFEKVQRSYQSKYNNLKQVKGDNFEESKENLQIMLEIEQTKSNSLLQAIALII